MDPKADQFSYTNPPTSKKLSTVIEGQLRALKIDMVFNDRVEVPSDSSPAAPGEWSGSQGLQDGLKKLKTKNGKVLEADFVFKSVGQKPNIQLVEKADAGAIVAGLIGVNKYLQVSADPARAPCRTSTTLPPPPPFSSCTTSRMRKSSEGLGLSIRV